MRRISIYATREFVQLGIAPNTITVGMLVVGLMGSVAIATQGIGGATAGFVAIQLYLILDCCDGEVARWTGRTSNTGVFLDRVSHYVVEATVIVAVGVRASARVWPSAWLVFALVAAILHVVAKAETDIASALAPATNANPASRMPRNRGLHFAKQASRVVPIHRIAGAIELSALVLMTALIDSLRGDHYATRLLTLSVLTVTSAVAVLHAVVIVNSGRLAAGTENH